MAHSLQPVGDCGFTGSEHFQIPLISTSQDALPFSFHFPISFSSSLEDLILFRWNTPVNMEIFSTRSELPLFFSDAQDSKNRKKEKRPLSLAPLSAFSEVTSQAASTSRSALHSPPRESSARALTPWCFRISKGRSLWSWGTWQSTQLR